MWMVGEGPTLTWQLEKQEGGPPALTQPGAAGDRRTQRIACPTPGPCACLSDPERLSSPCGCCGLESLPCLSAPLCLLGSPPNQPFSFTLTLWDDGCLWLLSL